MINELTFVIPCRLGSSRIKEKVLLKFPIEGYLNLIEHKVRQIRNVDKDARIILSCGEEPLYELAKKLNIEISVRIGKHIDGHEVGTRESICEVIKDVKTKHIAWTTVVTPLHDEIVIGKSIEKYFKCINEGYDSLTTGVRIFEYLWQDGKSLNYHADERHPDSQFLPKLIRLSNGIYISKTEIMISAGYFLGVSPYIFEIPKVCAYDIDDYEDYLAASDANKWYKKVRDDFFTN